MVNFDMSGPKSSPVVPTDCRQSTATIHHLQSKICMLMTRFLQDREHAAKELFDKVMHVVYCKTVLLLHAHDLVGSWSSTCRSLTDVGMTLNPKLGG